VNKNVLRRRLNVCVERNCLRSGGSLFHARGAATQNALSPYFRLVRGTIQRQRQKTKYKRQTERRGIAAFYSIRPGNGYGAFVQPQSPDGTQAPKPMALTWIVVMTFDVGVFLSTSRRHRNTSTPALYGVAWTQLSDRAMYRMCTMRRLQLRFDFDTISIRRAFDCLSKVIKCTVT